MREAAQVVSYEVPLGMCVVVPVLIAGTMDLVTIGQMQPGWFTNWFVFHDPFTFITFWVYFTCATASVNRAPFDLAEAESELVAGFHTEYSGLRWSFFFMAEYGSMFAVSGLAAILFFGGWNGPMPVTEWLGLADASNPLLIYLGNFLGMLNFMFKCVFGVTFMMWVRWTLPRLRIDQVMTTCLKYCTPIAAVMFLGATLWTYWLPGGLILPNECRPGREWQGPCEGRPPAEPAPPTTDDPVAVDIRPATRASRRELNEVTWMDPINWHSFFFLLFGLVACGFALGVVLTSNIVRMAFYLVLSLGATAGLFFLAGADFVGAMQLMIYVGGTLVLLIFGVMLTAQGPFITMKTSAGEWILGAIVGGSLLAVLFAAATSVDAWQPSDVQPTTTPVTATRLGMALLGARVDKLEEKDPVQLRGMSGYLLPFEIVSVHLLVVLIGAAYLARPKKRMVSGRETAESTIESSRLH